MRKKLTLYFALFVMVMLATTGCGRDEAPTPTDTPAPATSTPAEAEPTATDLPATNTPMPQTEEEADGTSSDDSNSTEAESPKPAIEAEDEASDEESPQTDTDADADTETANDNSTDAEVASDAAPSDSASSGAANAAESSNAETEEDAADEDVISIASLAVGTPGRYVNIAYGYIVTYPESWYTGFGNRPILASFSNLDPGTTNRNFMRETGCLIETSVSPNVFGATLQTMMAQLPQTYENAELFDLGGIEAVRLRTDNPNLPYTHETVQVVSDGRLFNLTADMSRQMIDDCMTAWEDVLVNWTWFTPDFVTYRNTDFGYSFSHPRSWFVSVISDRGEVVSSQDATGEISLEDFAQDGMVIHTDVLENPELLPLKQWILSNVPNAGLTNDILIDNLVGVRSITNWPDGTQKMIGYFQGPLGKIYAVSCTYPEERRREFRPIANAILYSFGF